jgi:hypothetical protein
LAASSLLAACDTDIDVDYAGRRLIAEGDWDIRLPLLFGGDRKMLVADADATLHILPFDDSSEPCEVGRPRNAVAYWSDEGLRMGLRNSDSDSTDALHFIDADCKETLGPLGSVVETAFIDGKIFATTENGDMHALDPWARTSKRIARGVTDRGPTARDEDGRSAGMWLLEGDHLLARDFDGELLYEGAEGVSSIVSAHRNDDRFAYVNADGVHVISTDNERNDFVHEAGCQLRMHVSPKTPTVRRLTLLSPCEDKRLVAIDHGVRPRDEPPTIDIEEIAPSQVSTWWHRAVVSPAGTSTWTTYVTQEPRDNPEEPRVRHTFLRNPDGETREMGVVLSRGTPMWPWLEDVDWSEGFGRWLARTDAGQLGFWSEDEGWSPIAEWVDTIAQALVEVDDLGRVHAGWVVLHDFDGNVATLSRLSSDGELTELATDVPREGLIDLAPTGTPSGSLVLAPALIDGVIHDAKGGTGTLSLILETLIPLSTGVLPGQIRLFEIELRGSDIVAEAEPEPALAFLSDVPADERLGKLKIQLLDGREFDIDDDVSSFRPSNDFARPGIAYTVARGPRKGLWFAAQ